MFVADLRSLEGGYTQIPSIAVQRLYHALLRCTDSRWSCTTQIEGVKEALGGEAGVDEVGDLKLQVTPMRRRARLVFFPYYVFDYEYGDHFNVHGERVPLSFQAAISGFGAAF
jgi:hypothetical protein